MSLVQRSATARLRLLTDHFRVVIVNGPRQSGKTTLLSLLHAERGGSLRSLDDPTTMNTALADPTVFAAYGALPRILDEVQRAGDPLVLAIKYLVDRDGRPGQFVLSGSTRFLSIPTVSESLAGRAAFVDVWPFTMAERTASAADLPEVLLADPASLLGSAESGWDRHDYLDLVCTGGFPEVTTLPAGAVRQAWFEGYLRTVITRDIRSFAEVRHAELLPRLLGLLAARAGGTVVRHDLGQALDLSQATVSNYLSYLDTVFLTATLPAWSTNLTSKVARTPKVYVTDPGLAGHLLGVDPAALRRPGNPATGALVETFVFAELTRLLAQQDLPATLRFFRDRDGREIDFILEARDGRVAAVEVKATATATSDDFRHLRWLRDRLGDRFTAGVVLFLGDGTHSFGDRMIAAPLSALWHHAPL